MIEIEVYGYYGKNDNNYSLKEHIEYSIKYEKKKLLSCSIRNTFWSFSRYSKKATLVWEV